MSDLRMLGPLYQPAEETAEGWRTRVHPGNTPQGGRDALAHHFLKEEAAADGDPERAREFADAANLMDWEKHDEVSVLGRRYRIVRIERYVLFTEDEPEPPGPADADPPRGPVGLGADSDPGPRAAGLKEEIAGTVPAGGPVPAEVTEDALVGSMAYPDLVTMPPDFQLLSKGRGDPGWRPMGQEHATLEEARDALRRFFENMVREDEEGSSLRPGVGDACRRELRRWSEEDGPIDAADVLEHRFRVARVLRVVRVGFDGPEPPRASDPDPELPPAVLHLEAAEAGELSPDDAPVPPRPGPESRRFLPGDSP
ncbi:hypothetical protein J0910_23020 [Nocardiopsis sp. CNT-189]|uniref:DUF5954 family protein n=1 Tax=Nocardiopsis oceanisediminis TaxID=2816862 RepID=UPI003B38734A